MLCLLSALCYHRLFSNEFHRMRLEGISGGYLAQSLHSSRITYSHLPSTIPRQLLDVSNNRDATTFMGNLCQSAVTMTAKKYFLMSEGTSFVSICSHCFLSWHWASMKRTLGHSLCTFPSCIYRY